MGRSWDERVAEYVNSPRLSQRLKVGTEISCVVDGNSGVYRTSLSLKRPGGSWCTCPSEYVPCKHVAALRETYKLRPRSFADLDGVVKKLASKEKGELLKVIRAMAVAAPTSLSALGVKGFEPAEDSERDEEDEGW
jgi:uncharacterized Zn finger protein